MGRSEPRRAGRSDLWVFSAGVEDDERCQSLQSKRRSLIEQMLWRACRSFRLVPLASPAWVQEEVTIDHAQAAVQAVVPVVESFSPVTEVAISSRRGLSNRVILCSELDKELLVSQVPRSTPDFDVTYLHQQCCP